MTGALRVPIGPCLEPQSLCEIVTATGERRAFTALWDTGASCSMITAGVAAACGLVASGPLPVAGAFGDHYVDGYTVTVHLPTGEVFADVLVACWAGLRPDGDCAASDVVIGMDLISQGEFAITRDEHGQLVFTFRRLLSEAPPG